MLDARHGTAEHTGEIEAPDRDALLVDWLNELIFLAEARKSPSPRSRSTASAIGISRPQCAARMSSIRAAS